MPVTHGARPPGWRSVAGGAILCLSIPLLAAQQADRARTEALARRATERLQTLQREADQLASDERTLLNELRKLETEISLWFSKVTEAQATADAARVSQPSSRCAAARESSSADPPSRRAMTVVKRSS